LVLKDFVLDGDEERVNKAALLMIKNLAGSLALVTCREPLRMTLSKHFAPMLKEHFKL
jgi:CCR4-NOT transcription complex subunit 1